MWTTRLDLWVPGVPVPKGSMDAIPLGRWQGSGAGKRFIPFCRPNGVPVVNVVANNEKVLKPWVAQVTALAIDAWGHRAPLDEPLRVYLKFVFPHLKGHYGTGRNAATLKASAAEYKFTKPDKDKLERAMFDALTDAGVWKDDALASDGGSQKVYGTAPGCRVWVQTKTKETTT